MKPKKKITPILSILLIPAQLLLSYVLMKVPVIAANPLLLSSLQLVISYGGFLLIILLHRELLSSQWKEYKEGFPRKILLSMVAVFIMHGLLFLIRIPLKKLSATPAPDVFSLPLFVSIPLSLIPLTAPFVEEIVFRHYLFYTFKNPYVKWIMFFISGVLFGLIHYNNFSGQLIQLIPYMVMGLFLGLVYQYAGNLWASISVHFLFNLTNVLLGVVGLVAMKFIE